MVVKQAKKKKVSGARKTRALFQKQLAMPAGFNAHDLGVVTLRDVGDPSVPTKHLSELTLEQWAELVAERLALQPNLELAMIEARLIDKSRAIAEVKNRTKVGKLP